jgi:hypothetical protein
MFETSAHTLTHIHYEINCQRFISVRTIFCSWSFCCCYLFSLPFFSFTNEVMKQRNSQTPQRTFKDIFSYIVSLFKIRKSKNCSERDGGTMTRQNNEISLHIPFV